MKVLIADKFEKSGIDGLKAAGCDVVYQPGKNAIAVAELAFALLLALDRRIPDNVAELRAGTWNKKEYSKARGLYGRTLGLLGYGNIGQEMAKRAHAFGMPIVVWSRRFATGRANVADEPVPMTLAKSPEDVAEHTRATLALWQAVLGGE